MVKQTTNQENIPQNTKSKRTLWENFRAIITFVWVSILATLTNIDKGHTQNLTWDDIIYELWNSRTKENFLDWLNRWIFQMRDIWTIESKWDLEKLKKWLSKWEKWDLEKLTWYKSIDSRNLWIIVSTLFDKPWEAERIWSIIWIGWEWDKKTEKNIMNTQLALWDLYTLFNLNYRFLPSIKNKEVYKLFFELCITLAEKKNSSYPRNEPNKELVKKTADAFAKYISLIFPWQDLIEVTVYWKEKTILINKANIRFISELARTNFLTLYEGYWSYALDIIVDDIYWK